MLAKMRLVLRLQHSSNLAGPWLSTDKAVKLYISKSLNQDNPISEGTGQIPLIALDVWEYA